MNSVFCKRLHLIDFIVFTKQAANIPLRLKLHLLSRETAQVNCLISVIFIARFIIQRA